ncbi:unnamed protein product [Rotaria socialis]|uniref:Transglutaminase-like domain-containing protein n=2 Tax=Rotaria socialis TaxID=392032 RepID=A0A821APY1_9BILA|nr:unnamed protein product [Rotaria socialis]
MGEHSTIYYDIQGLVLRRGQPFSFTITFNQDLPVDKYNLSFIFKSQTWQNFPRVKIPLNGSSNGWSAKRLSTKDQENNCVYFQICSPCDATIGKYSLSLEVCPMNKDSINTHDLLVFQFHADIYILFNPWNKSDACGLLSADQITEYAFNEHGQIYLGSSEIPRSIPWYFGQFDRDVLLTALSLLNKTSLPTESRIDISLMLRLLASNICSDPGANDGIFPPSSDKPSSSHQENGYTSSPVILKQYLLSNGQSVQGGSGSNWQHAAVFCSLCRSLGIPSRIVTVYNATCEAQEKENINLHWNTGQRPIVVVNKKVTRPWYLWNECWMRRDDIPAHNSGWQVVDSSAIDYNTKIRRIGPCSVAALKSGSLTLKWDTPNIYNVLNANRSHWLVYPDGNKKLIKMEKNVTDTKVVTKSLNKENEYDDITNNYKFEKSTGQIQPHHDVHIDMEISQTLKLGDDLHIILKANNLSNEPRTLVVALKLIKLSSTLEIKPNSGKQHQDLHVAQSTNPAGINTSLQTPVQSSVQDFQLNVNEHKVIPMKVAENNQMWTGCFDSLLKLYTSVIVRETGQIYQHEKYIISAQDDIMQLVFDNDVIEYGQPAKLQIKINNSFPCPLKNVKVTLDGFGISRSIPMKEPLLSKNTTVVLAEIMPLRVGLSRLYATLTGDYLRLAPKSVLLEVTPSLQLNEAAQKANPMVESVDKDGIHQNITTANVLPSNPIIETRTPMVAKNLQTSATTEQKSSIPTQSLSLTNQKIQPTTLTDQKIQKTMPTDQKIELHKPADKNLQSPTAVDQKIQLSTTAGQHNESPKRNDETSQSFVSSDTDKDLKASPNTSVISVTPVGSPVESIPSNATGDDFQQAKQMEPTKNQSIETKIQSITKPKQIDEFNKQDTRNAVLLIPEGRASVSKVTMPLHDQVENVDRDKCVVVPLKAAELEVPPSLTTSNKEHKSADAELCSVVAPVSQKNETVEDIKPVCMNRLEENILSKQTPVIDENQLRTENRSLSSSLVFEPKLTNQERLAKNEVEEKLHDNKTTDTNITPVTNEVSSEPTINDLNATLGDNKTLSTTPSELNNEAQSTTLIAEQDKEDDGIMPMSPAPSDNKGNEKIPSIDLPIQSNFDATNETNDKQNNIKKNSSNAGILIPVESSPISEYNNKQDMKQKKSYIFDTAVLPVMGIMETPKSKHKQETTLVEASSISFTNERILQNKIPEITQQNEHIQQVGAYSSLPLVETNGTEQSEILSDSNQLNLSSIDNNNDRKKSAQDPELLEKDDDSHGKNQDSLYTTIGTDTNQTDSDELSKDPYTDEPEIALSDDSAVKDATLEADRMETESESAELLARMKIFSSSLPQEQPQESLILNETKRELTDQHQQPLSINTSQINIEQEPNTKAGDKVEDFPLVTISSVGSEISTNKETPITEGAQQVDTEKLNTVDSSDTDQQNILHATNMSTSQSVQELQASKIPYDENTRVPVGSIKDLITIKKRIAIKPTTPATLDGSISNTSQNESTDVSTEPENLQTLPVLVTDSASDSVKKTRKIEETSPTEITQRQNNQLSDDNKDNIRNSHPASTTKQSQLDADEISPVDTIIGVNEVPLRIDSTKKQNILGSQVPESTFLTEGGVKSPETVLTANQEKNTQLPAISSLNNNEVENVEDYQREDPSNINSTADQRKQVSVNTLKTQIPPETIIIRSTTKETLSLPKKSFMNQTIAEITQVLQTKTPEGTEETSPSTDNMIKKTATEPTAPVQHSTFGSQQPTLTSSQSTPDESGDQSTSDSKKNDPVQQEEKRSSPTGANSVVVPAPTIETPKKESGFQLPLLISIDNKMDKITEALGIDSKMKDGLTEPTHATQMTTTGGTTETVAADKTPQTGSEFQMPMILSIDNTIEKIKEIEIKPDETVVTTAVTPSTDTDAVDKPPTKNGVVVPSKKSFMDRTVAEIKEILQIETSEAKDKSDKEQEPSSSDTTMVNAAPDSAATAQSSTHAPVSPSLTSSYLTPEENKVISATDSTKNELVNEEENRLSPSDENIDIAPVPISDQTKKQGVFQLPVLLSFDNTMEKIKDTLGIDSKTKEEATKLTETVTPTTLEGTIEVAAAEKTPQKEDGFHMPAILLLDNTMNKIKDTFGIDSKKKEDATEPNVSVATAAEAATVDEKASNNTLQNEKGRKSRKKSFIERTVDEIKEVLRIETVEEKEKSDTGQESSSVDRTIEKSVPGFHAIGISSPQSTSEKSKESAAGVARKDSTANQSNLDSTAATKGIVDTEASNNAPKKQTGIQPFIMHSFDSRVVGSKGVVITDPTENKEFSEKQIPSSLNKIILTAGPASIVVKSHIDVESTRTKVFTFDEASGSNSDEHELDSTQKSGMIKRQGLESPNVQKGLWKSATSTPTPTKTGEKLFRIPSMESIVSEVKEVLSGDAEKKDAARKEDELSTSTGRKEAAEKSQTSSVPNNVNKDVRGLHTLTRSSDSSTKDDKNSESRQGSKSSTEMKSPKSPAIHPQTDDKNSTTEARTLITD